MAQLSKKTFKFLSDLRKNNNREWFDKNKDAYLEAKADFENFMEAVLQDLAKFDKDMVGLEVKKSTFRIYKDVRFSKDKTPYKTSMSAVFVGGGKKNHDSRSGYYIHVEPGNSFIAGGANMPPSPWMGYIREQIDKRAGDLRKIIANKTFKSYYGSITGEKLKTAPKGYPKDHPDVDLLQYKSLLAVNKIPDKDVLSPKFHDHIISASKALVPFNEFLNQG
ncbi:MAG: DUF2461 domain-containing protein [Bacteroidetes bacterium]|nr:DUF2461 domain-containing protein [Bacteroidota bacterium]